MITRTCDKCGELIHGTPWIAPATMEVSLKTNRKFVEAHLTLTVYDMMPGVETEADICSECRSNIFNELCRQALNTTAPASSEGEEGKE